MYIVVSKWEPINSSADLFEDNGRLMRDWIREQPGVEFVEAIRTEEGSGLAVIAYKDQQTYKALVDGPNSPFENKAREINLEQNARWVWSERGETVDQRVTA